MRYKIFIENFILFTERDECYAKGWTILHISVKSLVLSNFKVCFFLPFSPYIIHFGRTLEYNIAPALWYLFNPIQTLPAAAHLFLCKRCLSFSCVTNKHDCFALVLRDMFILGIRWLFQAYVYILKREEKKLFFSHCAHFSVHKAPYKIFLFQSFYLNHAIQRFSIAEKQIFMPISVYRNSHTPT